MDMQAIVDQAVDAYCEARKITPEEESRRLRADLDAALAPEERSRCVTTGRAMLELVALHGCDPVAEILASFREAKAMLGDEG